MSMYFLSSWPSMYRTPEPGLPQLPESVVAAAETLGVLLDRMPPTPCATEPDVWFSDSKADRKIAALLCGDCALADECRAFATANDERYGVWGGTDFTSEAREPNEKDLSRPARGRANRRGRASA